MPYRTKLRALALSAATLCLTLAPPLLAGPITLFVDPAYPSTADHVRVRAHFEPGPCWFELLAGGFEAPEISGRSIVVRNRAVIVDPPLCGEEPPDAEFVLPALGEGSWSFELQVFDLRGAAAFDVVAPTAQMFLRDGRFVATAVWRDRQGQTHEASAIALDDAAGAFWFFDSRNLELTLKMLDGSSLNGHLWVFLASMTDVAYTVSVVDRSFVCITTPCSNTRVYEGVAGHNRNVLDTSAFALVPFPDSSHPVTGSLEP